MLLLNYFKEDELFLAYVKAIHTNINLTVPYELDRKPQLHDILVYATEGECFSTSVY